MSYQLYEEAIFGGSFAGILTVGYQLYNADGSVNGVRITAGIQDLGDGTYGALVTFPDTFQGRITWDTGGATPVYASAAVNPEDVDLLERQQLDVIEEKLDAVLAGPPEGIPLTPIGTPSASVVRAGIPEIDGCNILTRFKAFIVDQGVASTLEHVFRNRAGNPLDLSYELASVISESSTSMIASPGSVVLRVKEWLGEGASHSTNPTWEFAGEAYVAERGILRATLTSDITAGIYELNWAVKNAAGNVLAVDRGIMSVERTLFFEHQDVLYKNLGPVTLQELRMLMMDSAANENTLLNDIEFKDEQLLLAMTKPVQAWNEAPPPIKRFTTRSFPFRGAWASGTLGQLHLMAANHYRRNYLKGSAGGVQNEDKAKEREYMAEGQRLWQEYMAWMTTKKVEINLKSFWSSNVSEYTTMTGW